MIEEARRFVCEKCGKVFPYGDGTRKRCGKTTPDGHILCLGHVYLNSDKAEIETETERNQT